jgi:anaerobic ribonucleoside-triphosphate reductase activating protein
MQLNLSRVHFPVTTLGPGNRAGIWFQGCSIRCPGCISADTWRKSDDAVEVDTLVRNLSPWLDACEGVTISGGEPFEQPDALVALLRGIRSGWDLDVLVFTGFPIEAVGTVLRQSDGLIDALVSDPFDINMPQTLALRGSDNQRLHLLTPRGRARFSQFERALRPEDKRIDLFLDDAGSAWMAGIPARGDMRRLQALLTAAGHKASITQAPVDLEVELGQ